MNELQKETARAIVNVFETGRVRGDYSGIAVIKGDSGHLSYGRSQAALGSGTLFQLIDEYCSQPNAQFAVGLRPFLTRLQQKDITLDTDQAFRTLLKDAANRDPVMRLTQDQFFNSRYFAPACRAAEALGITKPLGQTVVYDSHIQGGWGTLSKRMGPVTARGEQDWVQRFIAMRTEWLKSLRPPLPNTVYRMAALGALSQQNNWDLSLPLQVHGVTITPEALGAGDSVSGLAPSARARVLIVTSPYLRGSDVVAVQQALGAKGFPVANPADGIYGPLTAVMVRQWQARQGISESGVAEQTRASLGI